MWPMTPPDFPEPPGVVQGVRIDRSRPAPTGGGMLRRTRVQTAILALFVAQVGPFTGVPSAGASGGAAATIAASPGDHPTLRLKSKRWPHCSGRDSLRQAVGPEPGAGAPHSG